MKQEEENIEVAEIRKAMPKETVKIIDTLPKQKREAIMAAFTQVSTFSGPIPPPEVLAGYEQITPGMADRIVRMAEKQSDHRIKQENRMVYRSFNQKLLGQIRGGILAAGILVLVYFLAKDGNIWLAGVLGTTTLLGLGHIFVLGVRANKKTPDDKK